MKPASEPGPGQFVLGPEGRTGAEGWVTSPWAAGYEVATHPDLPVTILGDDRLRLLLIGYALDPSDPSQRDRDLLARLHRSSSGPGDVVAGTDDWVGRWVLAVDDGVERVLLSDPVGGRQVHHATDAVGRTWAASTAVALARRLDLAPDEAVGEYLVSSAFRGMRGGAWMPGDLTAWRGCHRLLPNHLVTLDGGRVRRVPVRARSASVGADEALDGLMHTVRGSLVAAARRRPLTLLLTSGMDSRLLLAAARPLVADLRTVSMSNPEGTDDDVVIPHEFCRDLEVHHEVVRAAEPEPDLMSAYLGQDGPANSGYAANAASLRSVTTGRTAVTGHVAGVVKRPYGGARFARRATAGRLALEMQMGTAPVAVAAQQRWLDDAAAESSVGIHDLAYWEQRMGSWLGGWALEYDTVWDDVLWPFGSRRLLRTLLSMDAPAGRVDLVLWRRAIQAWWPELLEYPAGGNPVRPTTVWQRARRSLAYVRN